jgi:predicted Fe-Mo cluster-binding NifX family protein
MKIAIATDNGEVSQHFGRCPEFTIANIPDTQTVKKKTVKNPGHKTGFLPKFFKEHGVEVVIAGGAGFRAQDLFDELGIRLITGASGKVDEVIQQFISGKLKPEENICEPGLGKGYGVEKEDKHH